MKRAFLLGLALTLASCSPNAREASAASTQSAVHPESGLKVVPLTITQAGKVHRFKVEVAATPAEQQKGMMFRTRMGTDEGMVFPFPQPREASFWMRNTVIPLDLIFVAPDGRIANIAANAVPYSESHLTSAGPVKAVLELNGGRAAELGIVAGDRVEW